MRRTIYVSGIGEKAALLYNLVGRGGATDNMALASVAPQQQYRYNAYNWRSVYVS